MVPKGGIENKEFDMDKNGIDDLLKVVSPGLIEGYEKKNLDCKTLRGVSWESQRNEQKIKRIDRKGLVVLVASGLLSWIWSVSFMYLDVGAGIIEFISGFTPFFFAVYVLFGPLTKEKRKIENSQKTIDDTLEDFARSVEALNPLEAKLDTYTSDSVWGTLFLLAVKVLEAKLEFVKACRQENPSISEVKTIIELEQHYRVRFNSMFDVTSKFGLDFTKDRLYRSAQEKIDENIAWRQ